MRAALALDQHGPLALEAFRLHGPEGFALVKLYGPVLDALGDTLPLEQALILLRVNTDTVTDLLRTQSAETVAGHLRHAAAAGLVEQIGGSPHGLRMLGDFTGRGAERALAQAGADGADVVYEDYNDPTLRAQAVAALAEHGPMALALLSKYATDPDFREILRRFGPQIIPPIAQTDAGPETLAFLRSKPKKTFGESLAQGLLYLSGDNGQATIRMIKNDGLDRVTALGSPDVEFAQFLPLYDLLHLGHVVTHRQTPTTGEMSWALVDGCFVVADVLSLLALQPEGTVASELAHSEVKAATREALGPIGRPRPDGRRHARRESKSALRRGAEDASARLARWWSVRAAGGTYRVLGRLPEALPRMSLGTISEVAGPFCRKAGLKLTTWGSVRVFKNGLQRVVQIPPEKGIKYVGAQVAQATVGVAALQKMEEHLESRRPARAD